VKLPGVAAAESSEEDAGANPVLAGATLAKLAMGAPERVSPEGAGGKTSALLEAPTASDTVGAGGC